MHHALSLSIIRGRGDVVTRFILLLSADAYAMQLCKQGLVCRIATIERRPAHQGARFGRFSTRRMLRRLVSATGRSGSLSGIAASAAAMSRCKPKSSARVRRNNVFRRSDLVLWPRAEDFGSATTWAAIWGAPAVARRRLSLGLAMNYQLHVPVRESRMRRCQSGNGAQGFR